MLTEKTEQTFEADVRLKDGIAIIDMRGEINDVADRALDAAYAEADQGNPSKVVLNFSNVTYINSTGIALIVGVLAQARKAHREVSTYGLSEHYVEIFRITRLADFMSIHGDETSAVGESG